MENQRIRVSKTMLKNALMQLLEKKSIDKISIYELCDTAQLNRTTFYKYYGSQYDLLGDIENDHFGKLEELLSESGADGEDILCKVLEALHENEMSYKILINALPDKDFSAKLFNLPAIRMQIEKTIPTTFSPREREQLCLFFYQGGYALIREWLNSEDREPPKTLAAFLNGVITKLTR